MGLGPGDALLSLVSAAQESLLLVAPYIKVGALQRVLDARTSDNPIRVVTRWRLDELAVGVSDIEVWPLLRAHGGTLALHPALHAKYYAAGSTALVGSANLTSTALGWRPDPNLEILVESGTGRLDSFERELAAATIEVDDKLYESFRTALAAFPPLPPIVIPELTTTSFRDWRPSLRHPEDLEAAYSGRIEQLSTSARESALLDLQALDPPPGMDRAQFRLWVGTQLWQHPEVIAIDALLDQPRRFGELRGLLSKRGTDDGARAWQTWMRWLLHFLGNSFEMNVANYSEIFRRRDPVLVGAVKQHNPG